MTDRALLHLAVALDAAGWQPDAWRDPEARPAELFTAGYRYDLVAEAERGHLDFVTIEDTLGPRSDKTVGQLDAVLIASRAAPLTTHIGLIPTAIVTHTEPFHLAKAIATLDYVSTGRAGVRVRVSARADEYRHFGRRSFTGSVGDLFAEAADHIEVLRRLWDSWEDDAEIRDVATGRFVDRAKLHYIDFQGPWFSVKGPSITPARRRANHSWRRSRTATRRTGSRRAALTSPSSRHGTGPTRRPLSRGCPASASSRTCWCPSVGTTPATATPWSSPEPRSSWPICCWTGTRPG
jgi:alkanesulfonate monooxygenase SsuD/methylene tetrahydromethanopterin reductase-like flavin-dependent oxidoreductase (luciferase family)